jgi:hypothetical protein
MNKPVVAVKCGLRQLFPAAVAPSLEAMRPDSPHDPAVESVEKPADVGALIVLAPTPQEWIKPRNQFLGAQRVRPLDCTNVSVSISGAVKTISLKIVPRRVAAPMR